MKLLEQTWNFNITPRRGPSGALLVQVESLEPMTPEAFAIWLHAASQDTTPAIRPASRASIEVWRDTKFSPQPKAKLREMDEFAQQWKKFKRKYPHKSQEELNKMTREWIALKTDFLENFADRISESLGFGTSLEIAQSNSQSATSNTGDTLCPTLENK